MSDDKVLEDPTNRIVAVFEDRAQAESARETLLEHDVTSDQMRLFHSQADAENVDTSAKWFADTDEEIKRFEQALKAGHSVISVHVCDGVGREKLHDVLHQQNARLITHFGKWVTETMK